LAIKHDWSFFYLTVRLHPLCPCFMFVYVHVVFCATGVHTPTVQAIIIHVTGVHTAVFLDIVVPDPCDTVCNLTYPVLYYTGQLITGLAHV
jgi:hypothetical protein